MDRILPILLLLAFVPRTLGEAPQETPRQYQQALARECDALINSAIKRPYGWAWGEPDDTEPANAKAPAPRRNGPPVSIEPATTPAAGVLLLEAAALLGEPKFAQAARQVGRGVAAAQQGRGSIPPTAVFGPSSPAALPLASPLPDRAPTRAALALFLSLIEADPQTQDAVSRAAPRAAQWLLRQQGDSGAWPVLYPPGAAPKDSTRIVRLDTPDTRDSVLAMLLAYEVLGDPAHRRSAERSLEFLNKPHANEPITDVGTGLWQSAYTPSAMSIDKMAEFPPGFDALASRYCMQTFFATWVTLGDTDRLGTCETALKSLDDLFKRGEGQWHRRFDAKGRPMEAATRASVPPPSDSSTDEQLAPLRKALANARSAGRDKWRDRLGGESGVKRQLAWTLVGLSDNPMVLDFPTRPAEVNDYLKQHAQGLRLLEGGPNPPGLVGKIRQLWALYLRARIEKEFGM